MRNKMKRILSMLMMCTMILSMTSGMVFAEEATSQKASTTKETKVEQVENVIDILSVNDFHGNVKENGKDIGMAKMVGYINDQKAMNPNTLVVSAGDSYQGTALSNLTFGAPVNEMYKAMGLTASAVGNHEFDWGAHRIAQWSKDGGFPFLAANIYEKETGEPVSWAKPYIIKEVAGKKIAFIGLSTIMTKDQTSVENVRTLEFKSAAEGAKIWIEYLKAGKAEEGTPDVIVALTHVPAYQENYGSDPTLPVTGDEIEALCAVEGLDAVITGHSHTTVAGYVNGTPVVQAYKNGRAVGKISIELNDDKSVKAITPSVTAVYKISNDIIENEETKATYDKFDKEFEPITSEVIGQLEGNLDHGKQMKNVTPLGYWVADLMRKATGVQIGLTNGGGLRIPLKEGEITMGHMYEVMPFDNTLYTMEVTGAHLKALVDHGIEADFMGDGQVAGVKVVYDPTKEYENRIVSITLEDGTPIEMDKTYTLVTNDFIAGNRDKYNFDAATNRKDTFVPIRDVLVKAFKAEKVVAPSVEGLFVAKAPETKTYTIESGDVLWKIAEKFGTTYQKLAEMNKITNPHLIFAGDTLVVPAN
ncbi:5'-nucleotidase C-terminal domain-containing protein [Oceanirhabdus sp. W0125-5]|uniref:5'-nucleotidase C-terminal domain-containing protein n=1 Tax=Oceanirhabdus sp. W0125-5 TaxID=2999116 RepID=UPI0022F2D165|nr:5'-nucleotidase C-terminal domain-containing protein [Oceanirhabdus sp. W0125-5]WBW95365.1 5'-nucleotidase C-terminal domain-containing protein [Oceanirhabdus sp. W0125-5]